MVDLDDIKLRTYLNVQTVKEKEIKTLIVIGDEGLQTDNYGKEKINLIVEDLSMNQYIYRLPKLKAVLLGKELGTKNTVEWIGKKFNVFIKKNEETERDYVDIEPKKEEKE